MNEAENSVTPVLRYGESPDSRMSPNGAGLGGTTPRSRPVLLTLIWLATIWMVFPLIQTVLGFFLPAAFFDVYLFCYSVFAGPTYVLGWWLALRYRLTPWGVCVPLAATAIPSLIGFLWAWLSQWGSLGGAQYYRGGIEFYIWNVVYQVLGVGSIAVPLWLYSRGTRTYLGAVEEDAAPQQLGVMHFMIASLVFAILLMTSRLFYSGGNSVVPIESGVWQVASFTSGLFISINWIMATWVYVNPRLWKILVSMAVTLAGSAAIAALYDFLSSDTSTPVPRIAPAWLLGSINALLSFGSILLTFYVIEKCGYRLRSRERNQPTPPSSSGTGERGDNPADVHPLLGDG